MISRFAIYFVPAPGSPLARFGRSILGYDCETGLPAERPALSGIADGEFAEITRMPGRYGFHATMKAPFALAAGRSEAELLDALRRFVHGRRVRLLGSLRVEKLGRYLALRPADPVPEVEDLAAECVEFFDGFRAPFSDEEFDRRRTASLSPRQSELLRRWGYPFVLDQFRFHMTLAGPVAADRQEDWLASLHGQFASLQTGAWEVDALTVMRQDLPDSSFRVLERQTLTG